MALSILFDKKSAIDVYMSDTITLITSEYRYIHRKISDALKERNEETVIAAHYTNVSNISAPSLSMNLWMLIFQQF